LRAGNLAAQTWLQRHGIKAFDGQYGINFMGPVVAAVSNHHPAGLRIDRCPLAGVANRLSGAEDHFKILTGFQSEVRAINLVVAAGLRHLVDRSRQRPLRRKAQYLAGAAITADAIGEVAANWRLQVDVVRIGLQRIHRIPQRCPVRVLGIGVKVCEIGVRQARHRLTKYVCAVRRIVWPPGVFQIGHRAFEFSQVRKYVGFDFHGLL
jgi:hypothetical protein